MNSVEKFNQDIAKVPFMRTTHIPLKAACEYQYQKSKYQWQHGRFLVSSKSSESSRPDQNRTRGTRRNEAKRNVTGEKYEKELGKEGNANSRTDVEL